MVDKKLFGTDGIRGVANSYPMTGEVAFRVGRAVAAILRQRAARPRIVIGKDTRLSGYMIESALTSGICSMGSDVYLTGPLPTTAIAFLTQDLHCDAGMVISASHNPADDNGIKIFGPDGSKLSDELELEIERLVLTDRLDSVRPIGREIGKAFKVSDARELYLDFLRSTFPGGQELQGLKVVVDCANGAAYRTAPDIFQQLGAVVIPLSTHPDGSNINLNCGALHPEAMIGKVVEVGADMGLALDGDADRVILCDEQGALLDGDHILAVCGKYFCENALLPDRKIVATIMSNVGLDLAMKKLGVEVVKADVGDRYVSEMMRSISAPLGGEQSGHVIFAHHFPSGDGTLTALRVLEIMCRTSQTLSQLARIMVKFPQVLVNVPVRERRDLQTIPEIHEQIEAVRTVLNDQGRVLVRYSGTQPLIRIMVEGKDKNTIQDLAHQLASTIEMRLGL
ncbi:phosphoglucosamine mutase [bacterium]|nr:phosphoglucosamine mutase [bacterium]